MASSDRDAGVERLGFNTRAVRMPVFTRPVTEPLSLPIYLGTIYRARTSEELGAVFRSKRPGAYTRFGHAGLAEVAAHIARLENAQDGLVFPSGMSAVTTSLLAVLHSGDHVVCQRPVFAQTDTFLSSLAPQLGIETTFVDATDPARVAAAVNRRTRVVYLETPSNPQLTVVDIAAVCQAVREAKPDALVFADNTFATPYLQNPIDLGARLVIHSASKYLGGHADVLGGAVAGAADVVARIAQAQIILGGIMDPHGAWLLLRGMRTLGLRVERCSATAHRLARYLSGQPGIKRVCYPWLDDSPQSVARRQMRAGGGMLSFEVEGGLDGARRFVNALESIAIATSLGGIESVIEVPYELDWHESEAVAAGDVPPGLVRFSVGLEDPEDLERDLTKGLRGVAGGRSIRTRCMV